MGLRYVRPIRASLIASAGSLMKWKVSFVGGAVVWVSVAMVEQQGGDRKAETVEMQREPVGRGSERVSCVLSLSAGLNARKETYGIYSRSARPSAVYCIWVWPGGV